jgi:hypothetical protein
VVRKLVNATVLPSLCLKFKPKEWNEATLTHGQKCPKSNIPSLEEELVK